MRKSGLTGDEAYVLSKRRGTSGDLGPLKKELSLLKEDLSNKITKFYASNQGETHLADSDNGKIVDMMIYGRSEQKQYKGINLLPQDIKYEEKVEVSIPKGSLVFWITDGTLAKGGNFKFFNEDQTESMWFGVNSDTISSKQTLTINAKYVQNLVDRNFDLSKMCLGVGSEPIYEPYTGGQPSPSPDYPQEIKSVVNPVMKICGKNLYDSQKYPIVSSRAIDTNTGNVYVSQSGNYCAVEKYIPFPYGGKRISYNKSMSLCAYDKNYKFLSSMSTRNIVPDGTMYIRFDIKVIDKDKAQIELSENTTAYEPYKEQTIQLPITLNAIPVSSDGNVTIDRQQYIADYVDIERGKLVKCVEKFDLSLLNVRKSNDKNILFTYGNFNKNNMYKKIYNKVIAKCSHLKVTANSAIGAEAELANGIHVSFYSTDDNNNIDNVMYVCVPLTCGTTMQEFLEWANKNAFEILYILATPTEINLTSEEIIAFKALATYYPTTNISVNSDELDGYTAFNYPISMENGWNYIKQQLNDNRDYIYDMDTQSAEAYINSEYAVALTELEV